MDWESLQDKLSTIGESVGKSLKNLFGERTERVVRALDPLVREIADLESWAQGLSADEFKEQTAEWKQQVGAGEVELSEILPRAFALVREASVRTLGLRHYDVQMVGGIVLHEGSIAEMATGEGKTLVATLPLYLNCLTGHSCYVVTVNDYLARRDSEWMAPVFRYLGVTVGAIQSSMHASERHPIYACDVVYGTNNEFGFDYLRDNMKSRVDDQVQKTLHYAIIDEVDSILVDEARTPLIISGPAEKVADKYKVADMVARKLIQEDHFEVKEKERQVSLLEAGIEEAEKLAGVPSFYDAEHTDWPHYIENALRAHYLYELDDEYVVEEGEVVIVDEFTGRKMNGRRWSDGLHQAVETKEGLKVREENQTLATITFQNYFRLYTKLAGMTGTAMTEAGEFHKIYGLDVVCIPTNLPIARRDEADVVYRTEPEKWKAIADEIEEVHGKGQPMLVGTTSVEKSEHLSNILQRRGIPHEVLNAKNHEREAHIVAHAGEKGAVTVATNMAGRGTDIKLGGNFEHRLGNALEEAGFELGDEEHLEEIDAIRKRVRAECDRDEAEVIGLGGLYVLATERHESRRIDNQLRGRSGRQGDPGVSRFFLSLQDDLMRRFYKEGVVNLMERLGMKEGVPIESRMVSNAIKRAQKKVEDYYFEIRKNLLEYDEVMDEQRRTVYSVRQDVLEGKGTRDKIEQMFPTVVERSCEAFREDAEGFRGWFHRTFGFELDEQLAANAVAHELDREPVVQEVVSHYSKREEDVGAELMRQVERFLLLRTLDTKWKDHLKANDALRAGIGLRGYAQKDPKNEYKQEGYELFQKLLVAIEDEVASLILRVQVGRPGEAQAGQFAQAPSVFGGQQALGPEQIEARRRAAAMQRARMAAAPPPASAAFDVNRRKKLVEAQRRAQAEAQQAQRAQTPGAGGAPEPAQGATAAATARPRASAARAVPAVGRNDPCPCGSGKKYKKCHGAAGDTG
jgi:preprotein translocase subunit SecA